MEDWGELYDIFPERKDAAIGAVRRLLARHGRNTRSAIAATPDRELLALHGLGQGGLARVRARVPYNPDLDPEGARVAAIRRRHGHWPQEDVGILLGEIERLEALVASLRNELAAPTADPRPPLLEVVPEDEGYDPGLVDAFYAARKAEFHAWAHDWGRDSWVDDITAAHTVRDEAERALLADIAARYGDDPAWAGARQAQARRRRR